MSGFSVSRAAKVTELGQGTVDYAPMFT